MGAVKGDRGGGMMEHVRFGESGDSMIESTCCGGIKVTVCETYALGES